MAQQEPNEYTGYYYLPPMECDKDAIKTKGQWEEKVKDRPPITSVLEKKLRKENSIDVDFFKFAIREEISYPEDITEVQIEIGFDDWVLAYQVFEFLEVRERNPDLFRTVYRQYNGAWFPDTYWNGGLVTHLHDESLRPYVYAGGEIELDFGEDDEIQEENEDSDDSSSEKVSRKRVRN